METRESKMLAIMREYQDNPACFNLQEACTRHKMGNLKTSIFIGAIPTDRPVTMADAVALVKVLRASKQEQDKERIRMQAQKVQAMMFAKGTKEPVQQELRTKASYLTTDELICELLNRGLQVTLSKF